MYHHTEPYRPEKQYESGVFRANYGFGEKYYTWIDTMTMDHMDSDRKYTMIATEALTNEEFLKLQPHCQCSNHQSWVIGWSCPKCCGCLQAYNPGRTGFVTGINQSTIDSTRTAMRNRQ